MSEMGNPACAMPTHWVVVRRPAVALECYAKGDEKGNPRSGMERVGGIGTEATGIMGKGVAPMQGQASSRHRCIAMP
jgi:hypothetical protein